MNSRFKSTALILSTLWFAKDSIDYDKQNIDWTKIKFKMHEIVPSESEILRMNLAQQLWLGYGYYVDIFNRLDKENSLIVLKAFKIRILNT